MNTTLACLTGGGEAKASLLEWVEERLRGEEVVMEKTDNFLE